MPTPNLGNTLNQLIAFSVSETATFNTKTPQYQVVETNSSNKQWLGDTERRIVSFLLNVAEDALNKGRDAVVSPQDLVINNLVTNSKVAWKYIQKFVKLEVLRKEGRGKYRIIIDKLYELLKLPVRRIAQALKNGHNGKSNSGGRNQGNQRLQGFLALASASVGSLSSNSSGNGGDGNGDGVRLHWSLPVVVGSGISNGSGGFSWVGQPVFVGFYHDNAYLCKEFADGRRSCVWVGGEDLLSERSVARLVEDGYQLSYSERSALIAGVRLESHIHTSPKCVVEGGNVYCGVALEVQPYDDAKERILQGDGVTDIARYHQFYVNEVTKLFKIVAATLKHSMPWKQLFELFKWLARYWGFEAVLCI